MGYRGGSYGGFCSLVETKTWQPEGGGDQELGRGIIWGQLSNSIVTSNSCTYCLEWVCDTFEQAHLWGLRACLTANSSEGTFEIAILHKMKTHIFPGKPYSSKTETWYKYTRRTYLRQIGIHWTKGGWSKRGIYLGVELAEIAAVIGFYNNTHQASWTNA